MLRRSVLHVAITDQLFKKAHTALMMSQPASEKRLHLSYRLIS